MTPNIVFIFIFIFLIIICLGPGTYPIGSGPDFHANSRSRCVKPWHKILWFLMFFWSKTWPEPWKISILLSNFILLVLRDYWIPRVEILTGIESRNLFWVFTIVVEHCVLSIAGIIEGSMCHNLKVGKEKLVASWIPLRSLERWRRLRDHNITAKFKN